MQQSERTAADASSASALAAQGAPATGLDLTSHPPDGLTWHGYLIQLLHIASEIEHALMVQYLYAAYSLNDERPNLSPAERAQVAQWRSLILSVAREEMGHLLTVQNVLCLLGGQMELVRENYPFDSAFYPFPFRLERLSLGSLACYIFAEMGEYPPDDTDTAFLRRVLKLVEDHCGEKKRRSLKLKLRHSAHRVGELYQKISEILEDPKRIPDSLLAYESVPCQASADEWSRGYGIEPPPSISNPVSKSSQIYRRCSQIRNALQKNRRGSNACAYHDRDGSDTTAGARRA